LAFDLIVFVCLTWMSYIASNKEQKKPLTELDYQDFKAKFIQGLVISNGVRAFSLMIIILTSNNTGNNVTAWITYFAHAFPAICFVSAYMCLVIFFADTYFSTSSYSNHLIRPALFILAISCYALLFLMALITFAIGSYKAFAYLSEFLIGLAYIIIGFLTIYYGQMVSQVFESKSTIDNYEANKEMSFKLLLMSVSIGSLFLVKSFLALLSSFGAFGDIYPVSLGVNLWDFLMFLLTEIAPTTIFIVVGKKRRQELRRQQQYEQELNDFSMKKNYDYN